MRTGLSFRLTFCGIVVFMKVAVIPPIAKADYLANTVLDGLIDLKIDFKTLGNFPTPFQIDDHILSENEFLNYATTADLVILCWGKGATNYSMAEKINRWEKTIFVDGSELGKDNRSNPLIQKQLTEMTYQGQGAIDAAMLQKCRRYFRREKPYVKGILPFPFGIERRYRTYYDPTVKRDIDIVCIFGQEDYPKMRKEVRRAVEDFSKKHKLIAKTKKTPGFTFDDTSKIAGRDEFYKLLSRARIGVSVGGGGYDTARFWEIYGNGCILLTEKIDILMPLGQELDKERIVEFETTEEFIQKLEETIAKIPAGMPLHDDATIQKHTTKTRVEYLLHSSL
jgi:hypothetical protein